MDPQVGVDKNVSEQVWTSSPEVKDSMEYDVRASYHMQGREVLIKRLNSRTVGHMDRLADHIGEIC